jgi:hypothetical protein
MRLQPQGFVCPLRASLVLFLAFVLDSPRFALAYASAKVPPSPSASAAIHDALNVAYLCNTTTDVGVLGNPVVARVLQADADRVAAARAATWAALTPLAAAPAATTAFYVATDGSDGNPGTLAAPFATLGRAAAAARGVQPRAPGDVFVCVGSALVVRGHCVGSKG